MRIDFSQPLTNLEGEPLRLPPEEKPATLKWACTEALLGHYPDEQIDGTEKMARYSVAYRLKDGGEVDLRIEEIATIKTLVGKWATPLIVGQVWQMLESPADTPVPAAA